MIERRFYKAQGTHTEPVSSVTLIFDEEIPSRVYANRPVPEVLSEARSVYEEQAKVLAQTLLKVLPGGTFDQLLCEMFQIKASHFRVTF